MDTPFKETATPFPDDSALQDKIKQVVGIYLQNSGFLDKKITDTPTDDLQVVPRKYVNMYGSVAGRPVNSVIGQQFFDTTIGYPIFKNSNNKWVNAQGSVVGSG